MNGVFAVAKPSGPTSADVVQTLKKIFSRSPEYLLELQSQKVPVQQRRKHAKWIKIGHGGTLDPLADGVLVIGVGRGTKQLQSYLSGSKKTYIATAILGASTTTYDSEGAVLEWGKQLTKQDLTEEKLESVLSKFRGKISQIPPVFSALKMDGKPLYEYAREGLELPRAIEQRECEVSFLKASNINWDNTEYKYPAQVASDQERKFAASVTKKSVELGEAPSSDYVPPTIDFVFSVSSGTYIRSLIHDIGAELGTTAHMVRLTRESQGDWELGKNTLDVDLFEKHHDEWWPKLETILKEGPERSI